jgi:hypothetical protein
MTESAPQPGEPMPDTVTDALDILAAEGFTGDFRVVDGKVLCGTCVQHQPADSVVVERFYRFEGMSNPDDESIVFGLRCPECGARGTLVSAFGPTADPEVMDAVVILHRSGSGR